VNGLKDALRLAEALCARVCHDLSGPLGILGGMLEMLQEETVDRSEALTMASEAATSLQRRLQCLRAAWGSNPGPLSIATATILAEGLSGAGHLRIDFDGLSSDTEFEPEFGRALLGLMLLAADSLPAGGRIAVAGSPTDLVVRLDGPRAAWPPGFAECLRDDAALVSAWDRPRGLAIPMALLLARQAGAEVSLLLPTGPADAGPPPLRLRRN
jgi:histidine phosphotransferase ChpT